MPVTVNSRNIYLDIPYYTDEAPSTQYGRPAWASTIDEVARDGNQYGYLSYYQDGTYTRLQNLTIGYTLPNKKLSWS